MVNRAQRRLPNRLPVVRRVDKAVKGSNSRIQLMGQPRNCHQAVPTVAVRQNHKKTIKKKYLADSPDCYDAHIISFYS